VRAVPGPSAVTTALAVSGLASDRWVFEGFLPRGAGERRTRLAGLASEPRTLVFLESPRRVGRMIGELADAFGADRPAVLCRELTKTYEEVVRLPLLELAAWAAEREVRGEITLVVAGAPDPPPPAAADLAEMVKTREVAGLDRKTAMSEVARAAGVPRREVYDAVLAARAVDNP
jgi:16S rRNA (cytidine1402-2'-O)-methyltransferase